MGAEPGDQAGFLASLRTQPCYLKHGSQDTPLGVFPRQAGRRIVHFESRVFVGLLAAYSSVPRNAGLSNSGKSNLAGFFLLRWPSCRR